MISLCDGCIILLSYSLASSHSHLSYTDQHKDTMALALGAGKLEIKTDEDLPNGPYYVLISSAGKHKTLEMEFTFDPKSPITYSQALDLLAAFIKERRMLPGETIKVRKLEYKGAFITDFNTQVRPGTHQMHYTASACVIC